MLEGVSALGARGGGVVPGQPCLGEAHFPSWKRLEPPWRFSKPSQVTGREGDKASRLTEIKNIFFSFSKLNTSLNLMESTD